MQRKNPLTPYGKEVKHRLIELDRTNGWLIEEVNKRREPKIDTSFMSKVLNGKVKNSRMTVIIDQILHEEEERQKWNHNS